MTIDLFISCVMDQFYPETAKNVMKILDAACVDVEYNPEQTCCGKFAFTSGFVEEAKELGEKFLNDFPNDRPIVGVSASCVGYIKTRYQELFYNTASHLEFKRVVRNIYELTDFLVNKIKDFHQHTPKCSLARSVCTHDDIDFFVPEIRAIFQMFFLYAGTNNLLGVSQVHTEVFKCIEIV